CSSHFSASVVRLIVSRAKVSRDIICKFQVNIPDQNRRIRGTRRLSVLREPGCHKSSRQKNKSEYMPEPGGRISKTNHKVVPVIVTGARFIDNRDRVIPLAAGSSRV